MNSVKFLFPLILLLSSNISFAQPQEPFEPDEHTCGLWQMNGSEPDCLWTQDFEVYIGQYVYCGIATSDGGYLTGGWKYIGDEEQDKFMLKTDSDGELIWVRRYGCEGYNHLRDVAELSNGNYVAVGKVDLERNLDQQGYLLITDAEGDSIGGRLFGGESNQLFYKVIAEEESIVIAGKNHDIDRGVTYLWLLWTDLEGDSLRSRLYETENTVTLSGFCHSNEGGYIIAGSRSRDNSNHGYVLKVDAEGEIVWEAILNDFPWSKIESIIPVEDGYLCCGLVRVEGDYDFWLCRIDEDGEAIWSSNYGDGPRDFGRDVVQTADGSYVMVGKTAADFHEFALLKVTGDGEQMWLRRYHWNSSFNIVRLLLNQDDSYTLIGKHSIDDRPNGSDVFIMRTSPDQIVTTDMSSNHNNGILVGEAGICEEGRWGTSLEMQYDDGGLMLIQDDETLRPQQFTIEAWFKMDEERPHSGVILAKQIQPELFSYILMADSYSDYITFGIETEERDHWLDFGVNPADGEWHYIAGTYDGELMRLFFDGDLVVWQDVNQPVLYSDGPLIIGHADEWPRGDFQFYGLIDEVRISDYPREYLKVDSKEQIPIPRQIALSEPSPNPFNNLTRIGFALNKSMIVNVKVFDVFGREIEGLTDGRFAAGKHTLAWNASGQPSGVYLIRLDTPHGRFTAKAILVK